MVRLIEFPNPDVLRNEKTILSEAVNATATIAKVDNVQGFLANNLVLVEEARLEKAEIVKIASISGNDTFNLSSALMYSHEICALITKLDFNVMRLYKSTDGGATYTLTASFTINYQDNSGITRMTDSAGTVSDVYKVSYYNSETTDESEKSGEIRYVASKGYISVTEFKDETGIKLSDSSIAKAISAGAEEIRRKLYFKVIYQSEIQPTTDHLLHFDRRFWLADGNLDARPIDKNDMYAYEVGSDEVRTNVTSDISSVNVMEQRVVFGTAHPIAAEKHLFIEYWLGPRMLEDMIYTLSEINKMIAVNWIFRNIPFSKLSCGIDQWNLNGVSVNFNHNVMKQVIELNETTIRRKLNDLQPLMTEFTGMRAAPETVRQFKESLQFR
jgi:hypothetical protein